MTVVHSYFAHGLSVASDVELALPSGPVVDRADLVLRRGDGYHVPEQDPPGTLLATMDRREGGPLYRLTRDGARTVLRYPGLCEFGGDAGLADVTFHLHPGTDPGLVSVLAAGALIAIHIRLRAELALHASAVHCNGRALAFVGASGMGKSTLAAALCGIGYELFSDDVLRVDLATADVPRVHLGGIESRLRMSARQLAEAADPADVRPTADGRLGLRSTVCTEPTLPLGACVVPMPSRDATALEVKRLPLAHALVRLLAFPRVVGWVEPDSTAREFQALADLVERVPVFVARVPWGLPFHRDVLTGLVAEAMGTR
ncbi:hypothetical protein [Pseudonocardia sp. GCM10023141]|uniref:hypothetical protein n=1 Tax=Pseudonocardia sp. GCM10023141 TaxID=3252653 RepID=UPI003608C3C6